MEDNQFIETMHEVQRLIVETFSQPNLIDGEEFIKLWKKNSKTLAKTIVGGTSNGVLTKDDPNVISIFFNHYVMMMHLKSTLSRVKKQMKPNLYVVH